MTFMAKAEAHVQKAPQQKRSRESYRRMLTSAERLLVERGSGDFTLAEISELGGVSIGSIYCRFSSKEDLIYAVQAEIMARVDKDQDASIEKAKSKSRDLSELVFNLVDELAESFKDHAGILRAFMHMSTRDENVRANGKAAFQRLENAVIGLLLTRRKEIVHEDADRACHSVFKIMYSVLARQLGFGSISDPITDREWNVLKQDLGEMCAMYLTGRDHSGQPRIRTL